QARRGIAYLRSRLRGPPAPRPDPGRTRCRRRSSRAGQDRLSCPEHAGTAIARRRLFGFAARDSRYRHRIDLRREDTGRKEDFNAEAQRAQRSPRMSLGAPQARHVSPYVRLLRCFIRADVTSMAPFAAMDWPSATAAISGYRATNADIG